MKSLRSHISLVGQEPKLFTGTIESNIRHGCIFDAETSDTSITHDDVVNAARMANAHDFIMNFPEGYNTQVGFGGGQMSGGQKQRVSIARALIKNPKLFVFDDCLSAVDTETEEKILNELKESSADITTFIVSHRVSSVKHADQILILDDGKIVQQGSHNELLEDTKGYYYKQYSEQLAH